MNSSMILNLINLALLLTTVCLLITRAGRKKLPKDILMILVGFFCLIGFRHFSNVLEWSGIYPVLDVYEDYIRILEPIFFGLLFFAFFQHRLKSQIRESETRYKLIIDNQTDLVVKVDKEGRFLFVSPSYCRMFGKTEQELLGNKYENLIHEEDLPETLKQMQNLFQPPHTCYVRQRAKTVYGLRWIAWADKAILDKDGNIQSIVAMGRDITDQVRAEEEREHLLKALEIKNKDLQNIVYIASHDLQSPLVNIRGFAGELKRSIRELLETLPTEYPRDTQKRLDTIFTEIDESIQFIALSAERMQVLIDGLLTISRIGTIELKVQNVDMNGLLNTIQKTIGYQIQQAQAEVKIENLPPCRADVNQVNHVFSNLLDNAVKYLDPKRKGRIRIWGEKQDDMCLYHIADNGIGIEKGSQAKVFELFCRLNPRGPAKGVGLGLTLVARILERLGGSISLESVQGAGATFTIALPAADA